MKTNCIVFDCQDMPEGLCHKYIKYEEKGCNDVYLEWYWEDFYTDPITIPLNEYELIAKEIQDWMLLQIPDLQEKIEIGYLVLVKHWW